ncbi:N-acetyl-gamma-glutamyl-phosphate reductase [Helicobacter didelphidarum]|uniref:N-acetyl-gamma-glutamyl-phosphate reductase n=1 Tax=Helicobacter didelphidarum TaxID=2040648 RepID=A0A3D8IKT5_9HELI|nr:N-acetyl-gamma-glutamyl-phosphate reductase [Helicobacter didelphidarum]RDU65862.1 N-acetyl-gamma-glutamyl-phosphate reductase [Helicobacter didelphidarum]
MTKVAVIGASGYGGSEVLRILQTHDEVEVVYLGGNTNAGQSIGTTLGNFYDINDMTMQNLSLHEVATQCDCIITATPHEFLVKILHKEILKQCVVIDLSADFRLKNPLKYQEYYHFVHENLELLADSVYGLCELNKTAIQHAQLIANPGCYPTCSTLSIAPLLQQKIIDTKSIIIDAKSGVSGAGRSAKLDNLFCEVNENIKAYGLINHRHTAEIEQNLSNIAKHDITISFTPHLIPMNRGILITAYANLESHYASITQRDLDNIYKQFYYDKYFVRVLENGTPPQTRWVRGSNFTDVSVRLDSRNKRVIMMGAIDNLIKGAAGQAIQNLNLRFGYDENKALKNIAMFP